MFLAAMKSDKTYAAYNDEAILTVRQYMNETDRKDLSQVAYEDICVLAVMWFLEQHYRWQWNYVRKKSAALKQFMENLVACGFVTDAKGNDLLATLMRQRPLPARQNAPRHPAWRHQQKQRKTVRARDLRRLIRHFSETQDQVGSWIAGYLIVASRLGWRPGEVLTMRLDGRALSAPAEKVSDQRGLFDTVEISIGERYPEKYLAQLRLWIEETQRLANVYGGRDRLKAAMAERIRRACLNLDIPGVAPYLLRHFAIACLKRSGWSRAEIAAIVNHKSDRTAGERYSKARTGIKLPKRILRVDPARVAAVRRRAREFTPRNGHNHTANNMGMNV